MVMMAKEAVPAAEPERLRRRETDAAADHGIEWEFHSPGEFRSPDVRIVTSGGRSLPVHSGVLTCSVEIGEKSGGSGGDPVLVICLACGFLREEEGEGVAGAGEHTSRRAAEAWELRQGTCRPHPRRPLRRRLRLPRIPLQVQVRRGRDGAVRHAPAGAVARVPGAGAEARVRGGAGRAARRRHRRRRPAAGAALRRAAAVRAVHEVARRQVLRGRADRGLALPPVPRSVARAPDPPSPSGSRPEREEEGAEQGGADRVPAAERGAGVPAAYLHGRLHGGGSLRQGAAEPEEGPLPPVRHLPGAAAADPSLCNVREEEGGGPWRRLLSVQAHVAAASPPRLRLRPAGSLPCPPLQAVQDEDAAGEEGGRRDVEAAGEEGGIRQGDVRIGH